MSAQRKPGAKPTVPIEWRKDSAFVIASEEFKYADPTESIIREALAAGRLEAALEEILEERADAIRAEAINRVLEFIITAENPALEAHRIALAGGLGLILGINGSDVAKKFGITKQAVQQGVDRFCKEVGLRKTRAMRDEDAREKMSNSNYRPNAIGGVPEFEKGEDVES
jgi:hypothetical protein